MTNLRLKVVEVSQKSAQRLEVVALDLNKEDAKKTDAENKKLVRFVLDGVWSQSNLTRGALVHLINPSFDDSTKTFNLNNKTGFLVTEPDNLLTCTLVASSLFCERKTWLNNVFLGQVGTNKAMLVGTLVHEVFQHGVKNKIADIEKLTAFLDDLLDDATIMLEAYSVEVHLNDIRKEAIEYLSSVKEWIEKYMFIGPRHPLTNESELEVKIIEVKDIEENVWSTKYGLKGKIDVTGSVRIHDRRTKSLSDKIIPLELKTGNPNLSASHAAQVSLYSMMIEDRYAETNQGFVIYLKEKAAMHNVALTHNIKRDLIQRRNQINYHMKSYYFGPEMIDQPRMCKNCERLTECVLMSNIYTPGKLEQYSTMKTLESDAIGHLDEQFTLFFQKYHEKLVRLLTNTSVTTETNSQPKAAGSFWTLSSEQAEAKGIGFGKLQADWLDGKSDCAFIKFKRHPMHKYTSGPEDNDIKITDEVDGDGNGSQPAIKKQKIFDYFKPMKTSEGDVSPRKKKLFNTNLNFSRCRMAISLDDDDQNMDSQNSSTAIAIGFMHELKEDHFVIKLFEGTLDSLKPNRMYRVDKLEKRVQVDIERIVLVRLLAREDWRCNRVRQLILDDKFKPVDNVTLNLFVLSTGFEEIKEVEDKEQKFVVEAVSTDNYYILDEKVVPNKEKIHKTISVLTRVITNLERCVLIVANNIDNLIDLMRILQLKKLKFVLIDDGKSTKARYQFASNLVKVPQIANLAVSKKYDAYIRQLESAPVVITSYAMSIGGLLFTRRTFDYCIAYECDTTELLISLSPMFCSDRYIIIDVNEGKETANKDKNCNDNNISLGEHLRNLRKTVRE